ncbi:hypothetical protein PR048_012407 [Dryococelus australis]|uniref:Uncharacterized protein n=1 Tax=Dryococelus australis TaxID=614101 RepID=A0ABQ9HPB9_9NEOP|nr:hypothetical protein PR048_012407 [Dryococelus australis]
MPVCKLSPDKPSGTTLGDPRNEMAGETGDPRENPPTSGIVRHDSHTRNPTRGERPRRESSPVHLGGRRHRNNDKPRKTSWWRGRGCLITKQGTWVIDIVTDVRVIEVEAGDETAKTTLRKRPNPQYQFAFDVKDDQFTNYQNRKEQREGDKISGSYSVVDSDGFIRTVKYTADARETKLQDVARFTSAIGPQLVGQVQRKKHFQPIVKAKRFSIQCALEQSHGLLASHQGEQGSIPGRFTPDFRKWESCRTMPLTGGFSRESPLYSPTSSFRRCSTLTSLQFHRLSRPRCQEPPKSLHFIPLNSDLPKRWHYILAHRECVGRLSTAEQGELCVRVCGWRQGFKAEVTREPTSIVVKIPTPSPALQAQYSAAGAPQPQYSAAGAPHPQYSAAGTPQPQYSAAGAPQPQQFAGAAGAQATRHDAVQQYLQGSRKSNPSCGPIVSSLAESEEDLLTWIMAAADLGRPGIGDRVYQNMASQASHVYSSLGQQTPQQFAQQRAVSAAARPPQPSLDQQQFLGQQPHFAGPGITAAAPKGAYQAPGASAGDIYHGYQQDAAPPENYQELIGLQRCNILLVSTSCRFASVFLKYSVPKACLSVLTTDYTSLVLYHIVSTSLGNVATVLRAACTNLPIESPLTSALDFVETSCYCLLTNISHLCSILGWVEVSRGVPAPFSEFIPPQLQCHLSSLLFHSSSWPDRQVSISRLYTALYTSFIHSRHLHSQTQIWIRLASLFSSGACKRCQQICEDNPTTNISNVRTVQRKRACFRKERNTRGFEGNRPPSVPDNNRVPTVTNPRRLNYEVTTITTTQKETEDILSVWGRGVMVDRLLVSHQGEPGSIPGGVALGFSHVGIVPEDAASRRAFSGISHFPRPFILELLLTLLDSLSSALETSMLRATQISLLQATVKRTIPGESSEHLHGKQNCLRRHEPALIAEESNTSTPFSRHCSCEVKADLRPQTQNLRVFDYMDAGLQGSEWKGCLRCNLRIYNNVIHIRSVEKRSLMKHWSAGVTGGEIKGGKARKEERGDPSGAQSKPLRKVEIDEDQYGER